MWQHGARKMGSWSVIRNRSAKPTLTYQFQPGNTQATRRRHQGSVNKARRTCLQLSVSFFSVLLHLRYGFQFMSITNLVTQTRFLDLDLYHPVSKNLVCGIESTKFHLLGLQADVGRLSAWWHSILLGKVCFIVMEGMLSASENIKLDMGSSQPLEVESEEHDELDISSNDNEQCIDGVVLGDLPEVCIAMMFSCLLPREVAKLACVCRSFRAASNFDSVWERLLPPTYKDILALDNPDVGPAQTASKREIFDHLCQPVLLANNTEGLWIDRETGGLCLSIGARGLYITWGDDIRYWDWVPDEISLFPEVARLIKVCWFEAKGEIECSLPPGTYSLTWRMYLGDLRGWHSEPAHFTFSKNDDANIECKCYIDPSPHVARLPVEQFSLPTIRVVENGWTEYDVGEFVVEREEESCRLKFAVSAVHSGSWKSGLFSDGVVIRPTEVVRQMQSIATPRAESGFHTPEFQPEGPQFQLSAAFRRFFTTFPNLGRNWRR